MMEKAFYCVWNPAGRSPTYMHDSYDSAKKEAERLAEICPGQSFFVLVAVSKSHKVSVQTAMLEGIGFEIPF